MKEENLLNSKLRKKEGKNKEERKEETKKKEGRNEEGKKKETKKEGRNEQEKGRNKMRRIFLKIDIINIICYSNKYLHADLKIRTKKAFK